jgi:hypothetical protein
MQVGFFFIYEEHFAKFLFFAVSLKNNLSGPWQNSPSNFVIRLDQVLKLQSFRKSSMSMEVCVSKLIRTSSSSSSYQSPTNN